MSPKQIKPRNDTSGSCRSHGKTALPKGVCLMKALISGSFDPVTLGHTDIIRRASELFEEVHVVIFSNPAKQYMFTKEQRLELLTAACAEINHVTVCASDSMPALYCRENSIGVIVRGIRSESDFSYEYALDAVNRSLVHTIQTVFLPARPELSHISSSAAREMIRYRHAESLYLPSSVLPMIRRFCGKQP